MWLKGSSDITNLRQDLYDLLTGTIAAGSRGGGQAGNGAQVTGADAWTGLDATNFVIRSTYEEDPFSGEYTMRRGIPRFAARSTSTVISDIGAPTFSGAYSLGTTSVYFALFVSTTNTSPGNLTGTVVTYDVRNSATGASVASGTVTGWSGSSDTRAIGATGISISLTLGGSDQFVAGANAILWMRGYTTTFTQGVDYFPEAAKVTSAGVTVSNSPGGSNNYTGGGTDYTLVQSVDAHPIAGDGTAVAPFSAIVDWGGNGCNCGIAWNAGGSPPAVGATYYIPDTYKMHAAYYQVPNITAISSNFELTGAPMDVWDATTAVGRWVMTNGTSATTPKSSLNTTLRYGRVFTGTSQAGSTFINFWISVKADKIVIALRGDPGQSGLITILTLQRAPMAGTTGDILPWIFACTGTVPSTDGWFAFNVNSKYVYEQPYYGNPAGTFSQLVYGFWSGVASGVASRNVMTGIPTASTPIQNPHNFGLRYFFYSLYAYCLQGGANLVGTFDSSKNTGIRARFQGLFTGSSDNLSNLDEIVDSSGTYMFVQPTSALGAGASSQAYTNLFVEEN